ncbi:PTS sugar transporter subunit IIA [Pantoea sp. RRHST58]|uniref:PTS sugar transporter subunit IIA n=1 Tax=Pantoea sp. RRHST58 TaxID=3425183 RepID=UPI003DA02070
MSEGWLTDDRINIVNSVNHWKEAITLVAQPLLAQGYISQHYINAVLQTHERQGPYYLLAPGLALPHARPEQGALKNGLSLLHIKNGICFGSDENDPVYVVIMLCAFSGDEHVSLIAKLAGILCDEEKLNRLLKAASKEAIQAVIN